MPSSNLHAWKKTWVCNKNVLLLPSLIMILVMSIEQNEQSELLPVYLKTALCLTDYHLVINQLSVYLMENEEDLLPSIHWLDFKDYTLKM